MSYFREVRHCWRAVLVLGVVVSGACSRIEDQQIDFAQTPPETIILQVKSRVPDASQVNFTPVVQGKVWLAQAYSTSRIHRIVASRTQLLIHLSGYSASPPELVLNALGRLNFPSGIFSETSQMRDLGNASPEQYQSVYVIKGERYLLTSSRETGQSGVFDFSLHPRAYTQFETANFDDLPRNVQALPISRSEFKKATITEEGNGAVFQLQFQNGVLELTDKLEVLYSDLGEVPVTIAQKDVPQSILDWLAANPTAIELADFSCSRFVFNKSSGYRVIFQNKTEKVQLFFDISGKLRYRYFTGSVI